MLRAAALSLLVLVAIALMLPLTRSAAHQGLNSLTAHHHHGVRRHHSRAWWRRHRALMRRRRAMLARRKALLAGHPVSAPNSNGAAGAVNAPVAMAPSGQFRLALPSGWSSRPVLVNGAMRFSAYAPDGRPAGQATLAYVASTHSKVGLTSRELRRTLGGVPFAELRRTVINKMFAADGWVNNDLEREIGGQRVYVVLAQTPGSSDGHTPRQSWVFYFTEANGAIYGLATNVPAEFSEPMADESAKLLASFLAGNRGTLAKTGS